MATPQHYGIDPTLIAMNVAPGHDQLASISQDVAREAIYAAFKQLPLPADLPKYIASSVIGAPATPESEIL